MSKLSLVKKVAKPGIRRAAGHIRNGLGPIGLKVVKHSPKILTIGGIVGVVAGTVIIARSQSKADLTLYDHETCLDSLVNERVMAEKKEDAEHYDILTKNIAKLKRQTAVSLVKIYAPGVLIEIAGLGMMLGASHILSKRAATYAAIAVATEEQFRLYRNRVREELGEEKEDHFYYGTVKEERTETKTLKSGKEKEVKRKYETVSPASFSVYSVPFSASTSKEWLGNYEYDMQYILETERYFNDRLRTRGIVFLNEVYEKLGIKDPVSDEPLYIPEGQMVGWLEDGDGDGFIELRMFEVDENGNGLVRGPESHRDYRAFWVDFNVDGLIFDKI